jgi:hypothetical protein
MAGFTTGKVAKRTTGGFSTPSSTGPSFGSLFSNLQGRQDAANQANEARYQQGLQTFGDAFTASNTIGQSAKNNIADALSQNNARSLQSSISRGLGNTTIQDAMYRGNQKVADAANLAQDEATAGRGINLSLAKAQFIANRNDTGPDAGLFSNLMQQASSDASGAKRTGTITSGGSGGGMGSMGSLGSFGGGGGGGSSGSGVADYYKMGATAGGSTTSPIGNPYYGPIALPLPFANLGGTPGSGASQAMIDAGMPAGSIQITQGGTTTSNLPSVPSATADAGDQLPPDDAPEYAPETSGAMTMEQWAANRGWIGMTPQDKATGYSKYLASMNR